MSYTAFITRSESYPLVLSDTDSPISAAEFFAVVDVDATLSVDPENPHLVKWQGSEIPFRFCAENGHVAHDDPVPAVLDKMVEIASHLIAVVRGADGEFWLSGDELDWPDHPDFVPTES